MKSKFGKKPNEFPEFMRKPCNEVVSDKRSKGMNGYVFEGKDGSQVVIWTCPNGGTSELHTHDFDEYAVVLLGNYTGTADGEKMELGPGDECFIPAGVPHEGVYSINYRAIDVFDGQRVKRKM